MLGGVCVYVCACVRVWSTQLFLDLPAHVVGDIVSFIVVYLATPVVFNPYVRAKLVQVRDMAFSPQLWALIRGYRELTRPLAHFHSLSRPLTHSHSHTHSTFVT